MTKRRFVEIFKFQFFLILFFWGGGSLANQNDIETGLEASNKGDFELAMNIWLPHAQSGNSLAQFYVGSLYRNGEGVDVDYLEAARWFKLSADNGEWISQSNLGQMYYLGQGVDQSYQNAAYYLELAATQGDPKSQHNLAHMHAEGLGVEKDINKAEFWYRHAIARDFYPSFTHFGLMLLKGTEVPKNADEAMKLFETAAENNDTLAQILVGMIYVQGEHRDVDYKKGFYWSSVAYANIKKYEQENQAEKRMLGVMQSITKASQNLSDDEIREILSKAEDFVSKAPKPLDVM